MRKLHNFTGWLPGAVATGAVGGGDGVLTTDGTGLEPPLDCDLEGDKDRDCERVALLLAVQDRDIDGEPVLLRDTVPVLDIDGEPVLLRDTVLVTLGVLEVDGVGDADRLQEGGVRDPDLVGDGAALLERVPVEDRVRERVVEVDLVREGRWVGAGGQSSG